MQVISILAALFAACLTIMNYHNTVSINLLSPKFAALAGLSPHSMIFDMAIYTFVVFCSGVVFVLFFFTPLYVSLKDKYSAYKRELEKGSISNTSSEAKIQVLENKIGVLEKALDEALRRRN